MALAEPMNCNKPKLKKINIQTAQEGEEECGFRVVVSLSRWFSWRKWLVLLIV